MIDSEVIKGRCILAGLPESEAGKIIGFCKKKNIRHIFNPVHFVTAWRNNPKRPQIELNEVIRKREAFCETEKNTITKAVSKVFDKAKINTTGLFKSPQLVTVNVNNERNRILNQWGVK